ncbi:unnamed protein product [Calypogeia fissa]
MALCSMALQCAQPQLRCPLMPSCRVQWRTELDRILMSGRPRKWGRQAAACRRKLSERILVRAGDSSPHGLYKTGGVKSGELSGVVGDENAHPPMNLRATSSSEERGGQDGINNYVSGMDSELEQRNSSASSLFEEPPVFKHLVTSSLSLWQKLRTNSFVKPSLSFLDNLKALKSFLEKFASSTEKLQSDVVVFITSVAIIMSVVTTGLDSHAFVAAPPRKLQREELATVQLFKDNTPSVVYITNLAVRRDVFTLDVMAVPQGSGSGFIWDKQGHVVTNYHVIRGASDLRVTLGDQSVYEADVVGYDEDKDVAVLHIDAPEDKLRPLPVGSSSDLLVGQKVFAIGNPFGLDHTLTTGVISGLRREISSAATGRPIQDVIQTDAAINPGNSGGPLLDSSGNLIGINTAIYSPSGTSSGVGFSIPVDTVSGIVEQIVKFGKVTRPVLGISFAPEQSVEQLGVSGVLVLDAPPSGPAGKAGLKPTTRDNYGRLVLGDVITSLNGQKVANGSDLYKILDRCKVGETVEVEVLRGDKTVKIPVTLDARD